MCPKGLSPQGLALRSVLSGGGRNFQEVKPNGKSFLGVCPQRGLCDPDPFLLMSLLFLGHEGSGFAVPCVLAIMSSLIKGSNKWPVDHELNQGLK
jgi:hypothetical protein